MKSMIIIRTILAFTVVFSINSYADEPEVSCEKAPPKRIYTVRPKEPLRQEISIICGSQTATQTTPQLLVDAKSENKTDDQQKLLWIKLIEEFFKLLGSLAWPIAAVVIASYFKKELAGLLSRLRKGKWGNAEFEFEKYMQEVEAEIDIPRDNDVENISPAAATSASTDPRGTIVSSWIGIEDALFNLVRARDLDLSYPGGKQTRNSASAIRAVQKAELLNNNWIALFHDLRLLRNEAAHSADFSPPPGAVIKYVQLSKELVNAIHMAAQGIR